jgi:hypothetical protein
MAMGCKVNDKHATRATSINLFYAFFFATGIGGLRYVITEDEEGKRKEEGKKDSSLDTKEERN